MISVVISCVIVGVAATVVWYYFPVKEEAEKFIAQELRKKHVPVRTLQITDFNLGSLTFSDIEISTEPPAQIDRLHITYSIVGLIKRRLPDTIDVEGVRIDWHGGTIVATPVHIDDLSAAAHFTTIFSKIPLEGLLEAISGKDVSATGTMGGSLPVTIYPLKGDFSIGNGNLSSNGPGTLSLPYEYLDMLSRSNPQLKEIASAFDGYQYSSLEIVFTELNNQKSSVALRLKGNNPRVYNGRPIHLNLNIGGNLHSLITDSLQLYQLPDRLLRGVQNE